MILLTGTSDLLQVITGGTQALKVHASYMDYASGAVTPGRTNTAISSAATTTLVGSPASSTQRNVKYVSIYNADSTNADLVTVQHTDGTTAITLINYNLKAGETLFYFDGGQGWVVMDASGGLKTTPVAGRLLAITLHTSGTSHTMQQSTNNARIRLIGGGAGGGGIAGNTGNAAFSGGGAGGGYTEIYTPVTGGAAYTYAVGGAGSGGTNNANGGNGTNSTWTGNASNGTVVWTAQGGANGQFMANGLTNTQSIGGATTAANSANSPTFSVGGSPGGSGYRGNGTFGFSGFGGASGQAYGQGGQPIVQSAATAGTVGVAAQGYGGGGGGAGGNSNANGGAGVTGAVIVEEYA